MDTRTRTASPAAGAIDQDVSQAPPPPVQDKISAYYSLVFPHFTFYIQTLSITIGRRCAPNPHTATSSTAEMNTVDIDLGALKSVSRLHAKIEYDQDEDRFVLVVIGRNGAWVDGVWSGAGTRAPLSERSQIQIASRTFHFVLPPPPPPEDTPSPSSQSSANRPRSPSVDITSISPPSSQPSHSPPVKVKSLPSSPELRIIRPQPPPKVKVEPPPELPNSNSIGKSNKAVNTKKRKKGEVEPPPPIERPKPEDMPPKPPFTYAQLIYRAIKEIGGKATLQEICTWITNTHEYYRYADSSWMSSVRHNLSSGRAFLKMERCGGDRGKGFFWSVDSKYAQILEDQETKVQQAAQAAASGSKEVPAPKSSKKKDKNVPLEPALKRSVKGDLKGGPLPPPLTSTPLAFKTVPSTAPQPTLPKPGSAPAAPAPSTSTATTGVFAYPLHPPSASNQQNGTSTSPYSTLASGSTNPYVPLTHWNRHPGAATTPTPVTTSTTPTAPSTSTNPSNNVSTSSTSTAAAPPPQPQGPKPAVQSPPAQPPPGQNAVPDVNIPIVLGPIPPSHPDYAPGHPNNSRKEGYMVLHERTLILDPTVFSGLTKENLTELEKMGARGALVVLTGHMVKALKERRAKERNKERANRKPKARKAPATGAPPLFTSAPLERRTSGPGAASTSGGATPVVQGDGAGGGASSASAPTPSGSSSGAPPNQPQSTLSPPSLPPAPAVPLASPADPGSPIINIEDSDEEGPAVKRRKMEDGSSTVMISG